MAITLIDKIKPKNGGKFPLVDAEDVLMPDGKRLSEFNPSIEVDASFNAESENPVMNKTITAAMVQALEAMGAIQQDITNLQNSALPTVTTADNDKFLQVVGGKWSAVNATQQVAAIVANYVNTMFVPLTQEEYDALATVDPNKYYMIVGDSQ